MTQVNQWDESFAAVNDVITQAAVLSVKMDQAALAIRLRGFMYDAKALATDIAAMDENINECVKRLRNALGTREAWLAAQAQGQRERARE